MPATPGGAFASASARISGTSRSALKRSKSSYATASICRTDGFAAAPRAISVVPVASTSAPCGVMTSALPARTVTCVAPLPSTVTR